MKKSWLLITLLLPLLIAACGQDSNTVASDSQAVENNSAAANSDANVTYNPALCKTDAEGMVYFALGREVFRKPYQEPMSIRGMSEEDRATLPPRPDPNEPEGCPDNPLWGRNFSINYQHVPANPEAYPPGTSFRARQISFIEIPERNKNTGVEAAEWGVQLSYERAFERVKNEYDYCELLSNGLTACRIPIERSIETWTVKFQAAPEIYDVPFGRPFTVSCLSWFVIERQDCDVSYNYSEDSRIVYDFILQELPALEVIEFDKGLRERIESMRVENYRWADE